MGMDEKGLPLPRDLDEYYYGFLATRERSDLSYEDFMEFLRPLVNYIASSNMAKLVSKILDEFAITEINLEEFSSLYPSEPDFLSEVLRRLNHADRILHLKFHPTMENDSTPLLRMEPIIWTQFTRMTKLNEIEIVASYFTLDDLMEMSNHLPALRTLKVLIHSESRPLLEDRTFRKRFPNLEEFRYAIYPDTLDDTANRYFEQFTNFCITHLPNLREVRCMNKMFDDMSKACEEIEQTSRMQHLQLKPNNLLSLAANAEKFPHVTSLSLNWKKVDNFFNCVNWVSLEKFTKLIHVKNYDLNSNHIATFCFKFGAILESLSFGYTAEKRFKINMSVMKDDCPKLKKLEIFGTGDIDVRYSLASFTSLHDLQITLKSDSRKDLKLSNLLAAPNLKIVELSGFRVSRRELRETIDLIEIGKILTKVEMLSLMLDGRMVDENAREAVAMEKECRNFVYEVLYLRECDASVAISIN